MNIWKKKLNVDLKKTRRRYLRCEAWWSIGERRGYLAWLGAVMDVAGSPPADSMLYIYRCWYLPCHKQCCLMPYYHTYVSART